MKDTEEWGREAQQDIDELQDARDEQLGPERLQERPQERDAARDKCSSQRCTTAESSAS